MRETGLLLNSKKCKQLHSRSSKEQDCLLCRAVCFGKCYVLNNDEFPPPLKQDQGLPKMAALSIPCLSPTSQTAQGKALSGLHSSKLTINSGLVMY